MDISIIVLSFNTKKIADRCLAAVKKSMDFLNKKQKSKIEVIVVDNASADGSIQMIKKKYRWVKVIGSKVNLGFAKGNNLGMKTAKGKFLLLLNSDAFLEKETLFKAISFMKSHPGCDVLGCGLTYEDGRFQPSAGYLPGPFSVATWMLMLDKMPIIGDILDPFHPNNKSFFKSDRRVGWITGAFMFLKREVFEKTGGFDENYFMYTEEVEWCKRITDGGFSIFYTPSFSIVHQKFASSNFDEQKPIVYETYGILYFYQKHYKNKMWLLRLCLFLGYSLRSVLFLFYYHPNKVRAYSVMLREGIWKKLE